MALRRRPGGVGGYWMHVCPIEVYKKAEQGRAGISNIADYAAAMCYLLVQKCDRSHNVITM